MREFLKATRNFDNFVKMQLLITFVVTLSYALILPIVAKLQGLMWTASIIAVYYILSNLSNYLLPYLDKFTLKDAYKFVIIIDTLYLVSIPLYFVDPAIFLVAEATLMVAYTVITNKFDISYNKFLVKKYGDTDYENIQNAERMINSTASIIGYLVVVVVDFISSDIKVAMYTFMVILSVNLAFQYYNYFTYWNEENLKVLQQGS